MASAGSKYKVLPLPVVQKWAKKKLSTVQLREGIKLVRRLRSYPAVPDLKIERCGDGLKIDIEHSSIGQQGWLRAVFWVDEKSKTIYVVHLFWKKTNAILVVDRVLADQRISALKQALTRGQKPWQ